MVTGDDARRRGHVGAAAEVFAAEFAKGFEQGREKARREFRARLGEIVRRAGILSLPGGPALNARIDLAADLAEGELPLAECLRVMREARPESRA